MRVRLLFPFCLSLILCFCMQSSHAQMGFDLDIPKPEPYQDRLLKAEKTPTDKKIKRPKRFFQNLTTHYNYVFNAKNKLNEIIAVAKAAHQDDYSSLLPFYNYQLEMTAQNDLQLDSVIYKSQTGIVLHDLRNDWIDNLYFLWGASHFFKRQFDTAALMFQFINYAFAEKDEDGYYKHIGSRVEGQNSFSIATNEKEPGASTTRNDALVWQIRTFIEMNNMGEAGSLISTLRNDPNFPKRLRPALEEVHAYWFYNQEMWDSSATHLVLALDQAKTKQEKARWEYLAAQMFEKSGKMDLANDYYSRSIGHTTDPVLEVYARLNLVRINKEGGENYIDKNVAELLKMAKRDKYTEYRDVIYFMAAQIELERGNIAAAQALLIKGAKYSSSNQASRSKAYLQIAHLSFKQKSYSQAAMFYDSININDIEKIDADLVESRKPVLKNIVTQLEVIRRQDSLQRIAAMPEEERNAYISRLVKQLRKEQGLQDENLPSAGVVSPGAKNPPASMFESFQKGEWYFYNANLKTQGAAQFKQSWGTRPNVDNWRRFSDVSSQLIAQTPDNTRDINKANTATDIIDNSPSFNSLNNNLPLTPDALKKSDDSISNAMFQLGLIYINDLEDYESAITVLENLRTRFPSHPKIEEVLFNLYYAYNKAGQNNKANEIKNLLSQNYPASRYATILTTGKDPGSKNVVSPAATKDYEAIYDLFIEGKFTEAQAAKKIADSVHQTNFWQPQLLYIEAVYLIRQRQDSMARQALQTLIGQSPKSPLAAKAQNLIQVLGRRQQIEAELYNYQMQRPDTVAQVQQPVVISQVPQPKIIDTSSAKPLTDTVTKKLVQEPQPKRQDSIVTKPVQPAVTGGFTYNASQPHYAVLILNSVDVVFGNEAKNAFSRYHRERVPGNPALQLMELDASNKLLLIGMFGNAQEAINYVQAAKPLSASEILPWLKPEKYSFGIISAANLEILKANKDLPSYKQFLEQNLPGKF